jgi:hypothetical protein
MPALNFGLVMFALIVLFVLVCLIISAVNYIKARRTYKGCARLGVGIYVPFVGGIILREPTLKPRRA